MPGIMYAAISADRGFLTVIAATWCTGNSWGIVAKLSPLWVPRTPSTHSELDFDGKRLNWEFTALTQVSAVVHETWVF
jgi:hypothetical protein